MAIGYGILGCVMCPHMILRPLLYCEAAPIEMQSKGDCPSAFWSHSLKGLDFVPTFPRVIPWARGEKSRLCTST